jgi:biopolymer transport protein ExbB
MGVVVLSILEAAGWPSWFLLACSVISLAIILERSWALRLSAVAPQDLLPRVLDQFKNRGMNSEVLERLSQSSPLGRVLAAGLLNAQSSREIMKESIEDAGRAAMLELERFLTTLGTIASISPLLGLFGTVVGMIVIFRTQGPAGTNPAELAHGISIALYNTAFGLIVAVPSMIFYRHFRARVNSLVVEMEQQAVKLVEIVHGQRRG